MGKRATQNVSRKRLDEKDDGKAEKRRRWTAKRKMDLVVEGFRAKISVAELCRREGITQSMYYEWKQQAVQRMEENLTYGGRSKEEFDKDKKIAQLERKVGQQAISIDILKKLEEMENRRK